MSQAQQILIDKLLSACVKQGASDIHICVGQPPVFRLHGRMRKLETKVLEPEDTVACVPGHERVERQPELVDAIDRQVDPRGDAAEDEAAHGPVGGIAGPVELDRRRSESAYVPAPVSRSRAKASSRDVVIANTRSSEVISNTRRRCGSGQTIASARRGEISDARSTRQPMRAG